MGWFMKKFVNPVWAKIVLLLVGQLGLASSARADWFDIIKTGIDLAKLGSQLLLVGAVVGGIASVIYGLILMRKKAGDRGEDISAGRILTALLAGVALIILSFVIAATYETFGASSGDIGKSMF